jgi:hypothetical protein
MQLEYRLVTVVSCLALLVALVFAGSPARAAGSAKVTLRNDKGVFIDGKVTATKGTVVKQCDSAAGTCTLTGLAPGSWTVTAKTAGGSTGGPKTIPVEDGKTANVNLTLVAPATSTAPAPSGSETTRSGGGQVAGTSTVKNLGAGTARKVKGTCKNDLGVLVDGTVTVHQGTTVVGESKTAGGGYSIYDIVPGSYKFVFKTSGGQSKTRNVTIPSSGEIIINFQF